MEQTAKPGAAFPIVGIGASAGGLAALEELFTHMPDDLGAWLAFVLVQHLPADYKSILGEILGRCTGLQVREAGEGMAVAPGTIYTAPPNRDLSIRQRRLYLEEPAAPRDRHFPIDAMLQSLAADQKGLSICIILSGGGSDGTQGLKAIKAKGGMAIVQDPATAETKGMVQSAVATGLADFVLPPREMPAQLTAYLRNVMQRKFQPAEPLPPKSEKILVEVLRLLHARTGHNFAGYKQNTILRRIERRLAVSQIDNLADYLRYIQSNELEVQALFRELLVGVTGFFRDPKAFQALYDKVLPHILVGKKAGEVTRIWAAGCSTGEEAYSLAILVKEYLEEMHQDVKVQIFATDIDIRAIDQARRGLYPAGIAAEISPKRLRRFFSREEDGSYQIQKAIREMIIFAEHNVIKDPPFSRVDLISCRNLMIYLDAELQKRVLHLFHYALLPGGFLFLGTSETTGNPDLYVPVDRKWKLYRRKKDNFLIPDKMMLPLIKQFSFQDTLSLTVPPVNKPGGGLAQLVRNALLQDHAPACAAINLQGEILYIHGRTGRYLEPASGAMSHNILKMARGGLKNELAAALRRAATQNEPVSYTGLRVNTNGAAIMVNLTVRPLVADAAEPPGMLLVVFEEAPFFAGGDFSEGAAAASAAGETSSMSEIAAALERELQNKDEYLQSVIEELESANEELQSTIEEFHATNEELETSREELQSVNEELVTLNAELQAKNEELTHANNDMNNMLAGTGIGTIFVDHELRIKRFSPAATKIINLIQSDLGRPIGHIVSNLVGYDRLEEDLKGVLDTLAPKTVDVRAKGEAWYRLNIIPYRTIDHVIEGVVINFINITDMKKMQSLSRLAAVVRDSHDAITVQDLEGRILAWNPGAERMYGWNESEALRMNVRDMVPPGRHSKFLEMAKNLAEGDLLETFQTERITKSGKTVAVWLTATILLNESGVPYAVATTERLSRPGREGSGEA